MPRSHIKLEELHDIAVEINGLLCTPSKPWDGLKTRPGCYYVEAINDYVALVQVTDTEAGTREVLPEMHRGALLRQMQTLMIGIRLGQESKK